MDRYAIAFLDRHGNERAQIGKTFSNIKKAEAEAKKMNEAVRIKGNGKYIVIEL